MRTEELSSFAEKRYVELEADDRDAIDRIIRQLCDDPAINNETVFAFSVPPIILRLYQDERFHVVFELPHNEALRIHGIGRAGDKVEFGQKKAPRRG